MAESFVKTFKRDYARLANRPDSQTVMRELNLWFEHYNEKHPHSALGYRRYCSINQVKSRIHALPLSALSIEKATRIRLLLVACAPNILQPP